MIDFSIIDVKGVYFSQRGYKLSCVTTVLSSVIDVMFWSRG